MERAGEDMDAQEHARRDRLMDTDSIASIDSLDFIDSVVAVAAERVRIDLSTVPVLPPPSEAWTIDAPVTPAAATVPVASPEPARGSAALPGTVRASMPARAESSDDAVADTGRVDDVAAFDWTAPQSARGRRPVLAPGGIERVLAATRERWLESTSDVSRRLVRRRQDRRHRDAPAEFRSSGVNPARGR